MPILSHHHAFIQVCTVVGVASGLAWAIWLCTTARKQRHPGRLAMLIFLIATHAAVLLEVLDFPPLFGHQVIFRLCS